MKHARPDYQRIQDPAGIIPDDEPVFLLRAQDKTAAITVDVWAAMQPDGPLRKLAILQAERMRAWKPRKQADITTRQLNSHYV